MIQRRRDVSALALWCPIYYYGRLIPVNLLVIDHLGPQLLPLFLLLSDKALYRIAENSSVLVVHGVELPILSLLLIHYCIHVPSESAERCIFTLD